VILMPVYEYICNHCRQKSSFLVRTFNQEFTPVCSSCGSRSLSRAISSFAYRRSAKSHIEEYPVPPDNPSLDYYKDPRNIGRWAEKKFDDMGIEMPAQAREMIDRARDGDMSILEDKGLG
jgi:putative FmdB family regulatory protein